MDNYDLMSVSLFKFKKKMQTTHKKPTGGDRLVY